MVLAPRPLFPLFLKLDGHLCVVVGGGTLAHQKSKALTRSGARLRVVAPELMEGIEALALAGGGEVHRRLFEEHDIEGARLVIAATDDEQVNQQVAEAARRGGVLVNVVDVVPLCDFYTGGIVERGPLQVVIGTSGASPSLARRTRLWLEEQLPEKLGILGEVMGRLRPLFLRRHPDFKARARLLDGFVKARFEEALDAAPDVADAADVTKEIDAIDARAKRELLGPSVVDVMLDEAGSRLTRLVLSDVTFENGEVDLKALGKDEMTLAATLAQAWLERGDTAAAAELAELTYALVKL